MDYHCRVVTLPSPQPHELIVLLGIQTQAKGEKTFDVVAPGAFYLGDFFPWPCC